MPPLPILTQVRQALPGNGTLELTALGRDGFYWSDSHDARARSLYRLNAQLALPLRPATLALYGRNLTDERYGTRGLAVLAMTPATATRWGVLSSSVRPEKSAPA